MKAKEFVKRHKKLEADIAQAVNKLVIEYQDEVGIGVDGITITANDCTAMGDDFQKNYFQPKVHLDIF